MLQVWLVSSPKSVGRSLARAIVQVLFLGDDTVANNDQISNLHDHPTSISLSFWHMARQRLLFTSTVH